MCTLQIDPYTKSAEASALASMGSLEYDPIRQDVIRRLGDILETALDLQVFIPVNDHSKNKLIDKIINQTETALALLE